MTTMTERDYTIISVENGEMHVCGDMLSFGMNWPSAIHNTLTGETFRFVRNEVMEDWMVGKFFGHALYKDVSYAN